MRGFFENRSKFAFSLTSCTSAVSIGLVASIQTEYKGNIRLRDPRLISRELDGSQSPSTGVTYLLNYRGVSAVQARVVHSAA